MTDYIRPRTELGRKIETWSREMGGYTALAEAIGVNRDTLTGIIRGHHEPSRETVKLIAAWAEVTPWIVEKWAQCDVDGVAFPLPTGRGGHARAERLSRERLQEIATMGACARAWRPSQEQRRLPLEVG